MYVTGSASTGTLLTGCGKNKATEAASESAQTEKEGTGERTADSAEDDQKKTDETADTKTDKKAEKGTDAEETGEDASETEENREKIAVLLPDEQSWTRDAKELKYSLKKTDMIRFFFMQIMTAPNRCLRSSRWQPKRYLPW